MNIAKLWLLVLSGSLAVVGCTTCGERHPDSRAWEDVFDRDMSIAECSMPLQGLHGGKAAHFKYIKIKEMK